MKHLPQVPVLESLELTTLLIRHFRIHRGLWTLLVNFRSSGHNYIESTEEGTSAFPAVITRLTGVGLRAVEVADELSVDAAAVNPARCGVT
jgi:hypothetical protein